MAQWFRDVDLQEFDADFQNLSDRMQKEGDRAVKYARELRLKYSCLFDAVQERCAPPIVEKWVSFFRKQFGDRFEGTWKSEVVHERQEFERTMGG